MSQIENNSTNFNANQIAYIRIHPGIGVARVGNSNEYNNNYFIGPEVDTPNFAQSSTLRDSSGVLKRQAARFRLYGYDSNGNVVKEITNQDTDITWSVHLANKKAQWFRFDRSMDMPDETIPAVSLRNANISSRASLSIDAGEQKISGVNSPAVQLTQGHFKNTPVYLGELRTDDSGRLLVLGGKGKSESPSNQPLLTSDPQSFNNSDDWYDDISDGPVGATVILNGKSMIVDNAWVFVAPPNFAPDIIGFRTLYDLLEETYIDANMLPAPTETSFTKHILPIFQRLANLQWVNEGFYELFGSNKIHDFTSKSNLAILANNSKNTNDINFRGNIFINFHAPDATASDAKNWPLLYGDTFGTDSYDDDHPYNPANPQDGLAVSKLRYKWLKDWVSGQFINDYDVNSPKITSLDQIPLAQQPDMLDKAALHFCLADAFHPGCEVTWPMRHASLYRAPFRINENTSNQDTDYGAELTSAIALSSIGPLHGQTAGGLTRWMALPWQGDTARCRAGYGNVDPSYPSFWPARVPNQVLTEQNYNIIMNNNETNNNKKAAYNQRSLWHRNIINDINGNQLDNEILMRNMIANFSQQGILEARQGLVENPDIPETVYVETFPYIV